MISVGIIIFIAAAVAALLGIMQHLYYSKPRPHPAKQENSTLHLLLSMKRIRERIL